MRLECLWLCNRRSLCRRPFCGRRRSRKYLLWRLDRTLCFQISVLLVVGEDALLPKTWVLSDEEVDSLIDSNVSVVFLTPSTFAEQEAVLGVCWKNGFGVGAGDMPG